MTPTQIVLARAAQDQDWKLLDGWYEAADSEALESLVVFLENDCHISPKDVKKLPVASLEILRRLTLHMFRELALRSTENAVAENE